MKRYYIIFRGRVQGVGFRFTAQQVANKLGLTGWVRNLDNGDVDCEVQGNPQKVSEFIRRMLSRDRWIRVDDYSVKQIAVKSTDNGKFVPKGGY